MKNVIIGTAGHIDHGKTTLIKALTGRETDRLKEEKERGISIELGFTYFDLPSGRRAGIIDVPGHEKFIKNMLAGVIGMDIVILVVAADEGVMPQTKEHLDILNLLDIKKGLVAVTKADLVDEDWLSLVIDDITSQLKGTFLEGSPIIPVSSTKGIGIHKLIETIDKLTDEVADKDYTETPRLPVDRAFTISGFGTVVTGTLISGKFKEGDEVQIFPGNKTSRIRSIQVHGKNTSEAYAGQRVAINLAGIKKDEVNRGNVIAPIGSMKSTMMLDVKLHCLKDSNRVIKNRARMRLYLGTSEILMRVVLLDREELYPGESCYAQLRLEEETVAKRGDKFIIRFYSPMETIGGGEILDSNPPKRKRFDEAIIKEFELKEKGEPVDIVENFISENSREFPSITDIAKNTVIPQNKIELLTNELLEKNKIVKFSLLNDKYVIHRNYFSELTRDVIKELNTYHKNNPLKSGMLKEELRSKLLGHIKPKLGDLVINKLREDGIIKIIFDKVALKDFIPEFNDLQSEIKNRLEDIYIKGMYAPPKKDEAISQLKYKKEEVIQVYDAMIEQGILVRVTDELAFHKKVYDEGLEKLKKFIKDNGSITLSQFRDLLGTSRKFAVALLEDFDRKKITKRIEDKRILL
ncbi:selenocysteine-specific translation elongation factor SelB [Caloranaerobacter azorensis DSM 13643]|uniref:Selenocysteine-specific elongation factor n=1 Tax=Caloranaerobacter azorensis DSM 13643 TaxID=1121264 RepID=A0A1M5TH78_9FIRM|nr:selenocysteine-specific translation elongation factor [Caloranaerobacter azorensis]SHH50107.1 selenocysteine-specific translation elongation factor SelB [Caloranaerobacter azorensis DSM 13643]